MGQDSIWDHFQNEGVGSFSGATPRLSFLANRLRRGERVLNVGIGSGQLEELALARGVDIWSLDPGERAVVRLRTRLNLEEQIQVGRGQDMPFPTGQFDVVVMSEVLEHLDDKTRDATIAEVYRVLKPGGRLIGTVPARERLRDSEIVCPRCEHHFHRWGHEASFNVQSIASTLNPSFTPDIVEECFFADWHGASWPRRVAGLLKKFLSWRGLGTYGAARNIFFSAHKPKL